jgi:radical SAM protein with 4Fe4S-binding SPASM domain
MTINASWINLTDSCNIMCPWCYAKPSSANQLMELSKALQILDWLKNINCSRCILIGGEPTLHPNISSIFDYGEKLGIVMHIVSNGRRFASEAFCDQIVSAGLQSGKITFSMYASSSDSSKALTGSSSYFKEFTTGIKNLVERGITPDLTITITKPLVGYIDSMLHYARNIGVKKVVLNMGVPSISQNKVDGSFTIHPKQLANETIRLYKLAMNYQLDATIFLRAPFCVVPEEDLQFLLSENAIQAGCHVQTGSGIIFTVKGEITTCNHLVGFPVYNAIETEKLGEKGLLENAWEIDPLFSISESSRAYRSIKCLECSYYGICTGGCPIIWSFYDPTEIITGWDIS